MKYKVISEKNIMWTSTMKLLYDAVSRREVLYHTRPSTIIYIIRISITVSGLHK